MKYQSDSTTSGLRATILILSSAAVTSQAAVTQTNFGTGTDNVPGYPVSGTDLFETHLASAVRTGAPGSGNAFFYREDSGYTVDLSRLTDGAFGAGGTQSAFTVMPNQTFITFGFDLSTYSDGFTLTTIRTFAGWDSGRDGQAYTLQYSLVTQPDNFLALATVSRFDNTDFPTQSGPACDTGGGGGGGRTSETVFSRATCPDENIAHTLVELTSDSGELAINVAKLRFIFNGDENGGTGYREFDVLGTPTGFVPEPSAVAFAFVGLSALCLVRRQRG